MFERCWKGTEEAVSVCTGFTRVELVITCALISYLHVADLEVKVSRSAMLMMAIALYQYSPGLIV